jgi:hypothetical protein
MAYDLQSETDVKDYIEKLGIEYRFGCYSEKKPEGECIEILHEYFEIFQLLLNFSLSLTRRLLGRNKEGFRESLKSLSIKLR